MCRRSYVHPGVVTTYLEGELAERWGKASGRGSRWLSMEERRLLHLLPSLPPS